MTRDATLQMLCICVTLTCIETSELTTRDLFLELKALTDPIEFGVGLGFELHEMEIIKRNHPSSMCTSKCFFCVHNNCDHTNPCTWLCINHIAKVKVIRVEPQEVNRK